MVWKEEEGEARQEDTQNTAASIPLRDDGIYTGAAMGRIAEGPCQEMFVGEKQRVRAGDAGARKFCQDLVVQRVVLEHGLILKVEQHQAGPRR